MAISGFMIRAVFVLLLLTSILVTAKDKITSIAEARAAVKANVSTKDGEAFDQKIGTEFGKKYAQVMTGTPIWLLQVVAPEMIWKALRFYSVSTRVVR